MCSVLGTGDMIENQRHFLLRTCVQMGLQAIADCFIYNATMSSETGKVTLFSVGLLLRVSGHWR